MKKPSKLLVIMGALVLAGTIHINKANAVTFYDTVGTKYEGAVERLADLNIVQGVSEGVFSPNRTVTRVEFAKMLVEASLTPAQQNALNIDDTSVKRFKDVREGEWYYKYVTIAVNKNLMKGYEDGTFKPNKEVSYSEIAKLVTKALGHDYITENDPRGWDAKYLDKMLEERLFDNVKFDTPHKSAIRGDVANIIWNMLKADKWDVVDRNDASGFTYRSTETPLINFTFKDHVALIDAKITGFVERNGNIYVQIGGSTYKMFDQDAKVSFSSIGGHSDILLKRVEYPGPEVRYEVVGISTDVGSHLYAGTYEEFKEENVKLINKSKLSEGGDYAFLYHYEDDPDKDRSVVVNLSNTYLIDEIKIDDKNAEENKDEKKEHSTVENMFVDDEIAYRYKDNEKRFTRTITINKTEAVIPGGAVVFKDNNRIKWNQVVKDDVLVEITPFQYYMVQTGTTFDAKLIDFSFTKNEYYVETDKGKFDTYHTTLFTDYTSNTPKTFSRINKETQEDIKGKVARFTQDISGRIVKIDIIQNDLRMKDVRLGVFESYSEQPSGLGVLRVWQDGKVNSYYTLGKEFNVEKGNLITYKMNEEEPDKVETIAIQKGSAKLTDKVKMDSMKLEDLKKKLEYFEEDELVIIKVTNHYKFAKYKYVDEVEKEYLSLADCKGLPNIEDFVIYGLIDGEGVLKKVLIFDNREYSNIYYGVVNRIYRNYKDNKNYINFTPVSAPVKDVELKNVITCVEGDFIVCELSEDGKSATVGEHFAPKNVGYYKDFIIKGINKDKKGKVESYLLKNFGELDMEQWAIDTDEVSYRLNNYEVFLLHVSYDEKKGWVIDKAERFTKENAKFEVGDRIAVNEIEGTAIAYRGYVE